MLTEIASHNLNSRILAKLISNAGFKRLDTMMTTKAYGKQLRKVIEKGGIQLPQKASIKQILDLSFDYLQSGYRHEFVYKIKMVSDYILKNYSLTDSLILNEFKIGKSVADLVLVNGLNKVFEIKTELDSPERLKSQLVDYYKGFTEVYIVTHHSLISKYKAIVDEKVGLIEFRADYTLSTVREASKVFCYLDCTVMMKALRKVEFLHIIKLLNGSLPNVTQVALYRECLIIASSFDPIIIQQHFLQVIKKRIRPEQMNIFNDNIPEYLKLFCYLLNFTEKQYLVLPSRLSCLV